MLLDLHLPGLSGSDVLRLTREQGFGFPILLMSASYSEEPIQLLKPGGAQGYDQSRNFSSFAGVFPANDPRYVIVVALDNTGAGEAGGLVAAPVVARTLRRIAPMLGLRVEPDRAAR